jgi:hypothetical protein
METQSAEETSMIAPGDRFTDRDYPGRVMTVTKVEPLLLEYMDFYGEDGFQRMGSVIGFELDERDGAIVRDDF